MNINEGSTEKNTSPRLPQSNSPGVSPYQKGERSPGVKDRR